jgi:Abnormal spindle-like microcephaly-assoc'd, ASPM-SPD-2-Hydin
VIRRTKDGARGRRRTRAAITTAAALVAAAALGGPAQAAVHPDATDTLSGFPLSYTDDRGTADTADDLALGLCQDTSGNCIETARPNPDQPIAVPGNFTPDGEGFYFLADATVPNAGIGLARFGVEAAFINPAGDIVAGDQMTFERIRFRFGTLQPGAWYRITHPYGVDELQADDSGIINQTIDVGCGAVPCDFAASDGGAIDSFLTWDTALAPPAPTGYTGNALIEHGVSGSTHGTNFVQLDRLDGPEGLVVDTVGRTDTFLVQGKLAGPPPGPTANLSLSDNALRFVNQQVATTSETQTVTLSNRGTAAANLSSISLTGASAGNYTLASHCGPTLAVGASCTVDVAFAPTQTGTRTASLRIVDDAIGSPHSISLSGTAVPGTPIVVQPRPQPQPQVNTTIIQIVQPPAGQVAGLRASSPLAVSRLSLARRISIKRLRAQGLRASMQVQEGTSVVRLAIYKARNGQKTGRALYTTTRSGSALRAGLVRVTLRSSSLLRQLRVGSYVFEARAGRSAATLGSARRVTFTVTR